MCRKIIYPMLYGKIMMIKGLQQPQTHVPPLGQAIHTVLLCSWSLVMDPLCLCCKFFYTIYAGMQIFVPVATSILATLAGGLGT